MNFMLFVVPILLIIGIYLFQKSQAAKVLQAIKNLKKDQYILVDVREEGEFNDGSVNGAVNFPLSNLQHELAGLNKSKTLIVFCKSGVRATAAISVLKKNGFEKTINGGSFMVLKDMF